MKKVGGSKKERIRKVFRHIKRKSKEEEGEEEEGESNLYISVTKFLTLNREKKKGRGE